LALFNYCPVKNLLIIFISLFISDDDDDSDADLVTDYLDAPISLSINTPKLRIPSTKTTITTTPPPNIKNYFSSTDDTEKDLMSNSGCPNGTRNGSSNHINTANNCNTITITTPSGHTNNNNIILNNNHNNINNMVPIISVTPHSPGVKYNSILEDSLNHLQSIRESVVQMKNSSAQNTSFGVVNPTVENILSCSYKHKNSNAKFPSIVGIIKDFQLMSFVTES
jgi:A-kinase anchor protein 13